MPEPVPTRSKVIGLWEVEIEEPRPPADQFKEWLESEPPFETWAKIIPTVERR